MDEAAQVKLAKAGFSALKARDAIASIREQLKMVGADKDALSEEIQRKWQELSHAYVALLDLQKDYPEEDRIGNAVSTVDAYFADLNMEKPALP